MLRGRILAESLRVGFELVVPSLGLVRVSRVDVSASRAAGQPETWTLLDVTAPDESADELAAALAAGLAADGGWYADFRVGREHFVVFAGKVFRYTMGDTAGRDAAIAYGRSVGVPERQLDWDSSPT